MGSSGGYGHEVMIIKTPEQGAEQHLVQLFLLSIKGRAPVCYKVHLGSVVTGTQAGVQPQTKHQGWSDTPKQGTFLTSGKH